MKYVWEHCALEYFWKILLGVLERTRSTRCWEPHWISIVSLHLTAVLSYRPLGVSSRGSYWPHFLPCVSFKITEHTNGFAFIWSLKDVCLLSRQSKPFQVQHHHHHHHHHIWLISAHSFLTSLTVTRGPGSLVQCPHKFADGMTLPALLYLQETWLIWLQRNANVEEKNKHAGHFILMPHTRIVFQWLRLLTSVSIEFRDMTGQAHILGWGEGGCWRNRILKRDRRKRGKENTLKMYFHAFLMPFRRRNTPFVPRLLSGLWRWPLPAPACGRALQWYSWRPRR